MILQANYDEALDTKSAVLMPMILVMGEVMKFLVCGFSIARLHTADILLKNDIWLLLTILCWHKRGAWIKIIPKIPSRTLLP